MPKRTLFVALAIGWLGISAAAGAQADAISVGSFPLDPVPSYLPTPTPPAFNVPVEISGAVNLQNWQFSLLFDKEGNNPNFSITNAVVLAPVPAPEAGSLGLLATRTLLAAFFAVHRVKGSTI